MLREGFERALLSSAQMPIVPMRLGLLERLLRSPEGEAEFALAVDTRREFAGVRPLTVRPPWLRVWPVGVGDVEELDATEPTEAAIGSVLELLAEGDRAPFWLEVVTDRFCVAVVALSLNSGLAAALSVSAAASSMSCVRTIPSESLAPPTELGPLLV